MEARDAREVAKKLIKSGAIGPIVKTPKRAENEGFKRPSRFRGLERKMIEEKTVAGYQPFASSPADEREEVAKPSFIPKVKVCFGGWTEGTVRLESTSVSFFFYFSFLSESLR